MKKKNSLLSAIGIGLILWSLPMLSKINLHQKKWTQEYRRISGKQQVRFTQYSTYC